MVTVRVAENVRLDSTLSKLSKIMGQTCEKNEGKFHTQIRYIQYEYILPFSCSGIFLNSPVDRSKLAWYKTSRDDIMKYRRCLLTNLDNISKFQRSTFTFTFTLRCPVAPARNEPFFWHNL